MIRNKVKYGLYNPIEMTYAAPDSKKIMSLVNKKLILERGDNDSDLIGFLRVEGSSICKVIFFSRKIFVYIKG